MANVYYYGDPAWTYDIMDPSYTAVAWVTANFFTDAAHTTGYGSVPQSGDSVYLATDSYAVVYIQNGVTVNIGAGTCYVEVMMLGGSAIAGGIYDENVSMVWDGNGNGTISGGTFNGDNVYGAVSITGGTFNSILNGLSYAQIDGGTFNGAVALGDSEFALIRSGTFHNTVSIAYGSQLMDGTFNANVTVDGRYDPDSVMWSLTGGTFNCDTVTITYLGGGLAGCTATFNVRKIVLGFPSSITGVRAVTLGDAPAFTYEKGVNGSGILGMT